MRNLAPDIFRQRLLVEHYYSGEMTADRLAEYLLYKCKGFDEAAAVEFTGKFFKAQGEMASQSL